MNQKINSIVIFVITFLWFFIEAIIHYNIGKNKKKFVLPPLKDLGKIIGTITLFSLLNTFTIFIIEKYIFKINNTHSYRY